MKTIAMNEKPDYYAIKVMHPAESIEITERIEWCKENEITWFPKTIRGTIVGGVHYEEEEMQKIGKLLLQDDNGVTLGEIDLSTLPPINIGMGFVFHNEIDAVAFKLRWI